MSRSGWKASFGSRVGEAHMFVRTCWTLVTVVAALVGGVGVIALPAAMSGAWFAVGLLVAFGVMSAHVTRPGGGTALRAGAIAGAVTVATCLVLAGLVAIMGAVAALVIPLLLIALGVWAWRRRGTWRTATTSAGFGPGIAPPAAEPVAQQQAAVAAPMVVADTVSTQALCAAWCRTYWLLRDLPPGPACAQVLRTREGLLDELERRDPVGFHRWLDTGARAGSDPGRYLIAGA